MANNLLHFLFRFSLATSAAGEEELAQPYDSGSFCPSWDHSAQGSLPVCVLGSNSSTLCTLQLPPPPPRSCPAVPEGWRQVTLVRLLDGVRL